MKEALSGVLGNGGGKPEAEPEKKKLFGMNLAQTSFGNLMRQPSMMPMGFGGLNNMFAR